jgi:hypothetical protein
MNGIRYEHHNFFYYMSKQRWNAEAVFIIQITAKVSSAPIRETRRRRQHTL